MPHLTNTVIIGRRAGRRAGRQADIADMRDIGEDKARLPACLLPAGFGRKASYGPQCDRDVAFPSFTLQRKEDSGVKLLLP